MYGTGVETVVASGRPAIGACARATVTAWSADEEPVTATARIAPASRSLSTSERVSTPVSATMPRSCSQSVHAGPRASRITTARAWTVADSLRPSATP